MGDYDCDADDDDDAGADADDANDDADDADDADDDDDASKDVQKVSGQQGSVRTTHAAADYQEFTAPHSAYTIVQHYSTLSNTAQWLILHHRPTLFHTAQDCPTWLSHILHTPSPTLPYTTLPNSGQHHCSAPFM